MVVKAINSIEDEDNELESVESEDEEDKIALLNKNLQNVAS